MSDVSAIDRQEAFSGTKDVAPALALDVQRLQGYLIQNLPGFARPLTIRQFKGGQSNPTYLLETPARAYVLRRKPPGKLLPSAHAVDREYRVIRALARHDFPLAAPLLYCDDETVLGTPFYLMDFVDGRVFWEPQMTSSYPQERSAVYGVMGATIARLHSFDPAAIGLADFGKGENYVARQVERWSKQYRASETETIDAMEKLIEWLPGHIPPSGPPRLVHGDYRLDNLIIAHEQPEDSRGARLGTVDAGRSAGRFHLSFDGLAHAVVGKRRRHRLAGRLQSQRARHSLDGGVRRFLRRAHQA